MSLDYGIKISKPGVDVGTAELENLYFTSEKSVLKTYIVVTSNYTFESDIDEVTIEIDHNLGYIPMIWASISGPDTLDGPDTNSYWAQYYNSGSDKALRYWFSDADSSKAYIYYGESSQAGAGYDPTGEEWTFKTYIFYEQGS